MAPTYPFPLNCIFKGCTIHLFHNEIHSWNKSRDAIGVGMGIPWFSLFLISASQLARGEESHPQTQWTDITQKWCQHFNNVTWQHSGFGGKRWFEGNLLPNQSTTMQHPQHADITSVWRKHNTALHPTSGYSLRSQCDHRTWQPGTNLLPNKEYKGTVKMY